MPVGAPLVDVAADPEEEFRPLARLPGAIVSRDEVVLVEPDPDYFVRLAASRGDRADRAFASALKRTYPQSVWPVYNERQTDYSGCTRFGSLTLVDAYRVWTAFQHTFPGRYVDPVAKDVDAVVRELTTSTCAWNSTSLPT
jgi:hypothetical protein